MCYEREKSLHHIYIKKCNMREIQSHHHLHFLSSSINRNNIQLNKFYIYSGYDNTSCEVIQKKSVLNKIPQSCEMVR